MGSRMSVEERVEIIVNKFKKCPDVTVNGAIVRFCSTSSSHSLQQHLHNRKLEDYITADKIKQLGETLADLSPNVILAGLGALAIAVCIDIISDVGSDSTEDALRSVFAEEKASEVWDQIDECLKRYRMNINNQDELVTDMRRIECQLSAALTKLKNSMLRDGHMSSEALKAWVNGAAFHIQMLIHLVRLGGIQTRDPVERLLCTYLSDLDPLFEKHQAAVKEKCKVGHSFLRGLRRIVLNENHRYFQVETGEMHFIEEYEAYLFKDFLEAYYEKKYSSQKSTIRRYFTEVRDDLPGLLSQEGHLSIQ